MIRLSTGSLVIVIEESIIPEFKVLVNRACNCWTDASPVIKEFADRVCIGEVLQDYRSQDTSGSKKKIKGNNQ